MTTSIFVSARTLSALTLTMGLSIYNANGASTESLETATPLQVARNTTGASPSKNNCTDSNDSCDKISLSEKHNEMAKYTRYRGKVDWNNAYRRFGYGTSLSFQKVTELEWQQEGNGGRSFDLYKKVPENAFADENTVKND